MTTGEATDVESEQQQEADVKKSTEDEELVDYVARAQWLRAAVLGANDGLLSTASLVVGVGAFTADSKATAVTGIAGAVAGALSMAAGEFVSVCSQRDIELAHREEKKESASSDVAIPSPSRAAAASAAAFAAGAAVPLLAACFVREYKVRVGVVVGVVSFALLGSGGLSAFLGKAPPLKSAVRVLIGGWFAMIVTFGLTKLVASFGL